MATPTRHTYLRPNGIVDSDSDSNPGESQILSMEVAEEDASIVNNAVLGEQSIELSMRAAPVEVKVQETFLNELHGSLSARYPELLFSMASGKMAGVSTMDIPVMLIAQKTLHHHPPYGLVSRIQVSVQYKFYTISVLMRVWRKEAFESFDDLDVVCKMIGNNTKHKFCPGLEMTR